MDLQRKRLKSIASFVQPYRSIIDVGTDHCLIPIYLLEQNLIDVAIATDINQGPLNEAQKNIKSYQLEDKIETRLGSGLGVINQADNVDVIIVAGMGGTLITEILDSGQAVLPFNQRLILQPNVNEEKVRIWLCENHYEIVHEKIVKEDDIFYEVIVANRIKDSIKYNQNELLFGPILLKEKNSDFIEKWQQILQNKQRIYQKIPDNHPNKIIFLSEINRIKQVISL